MRGVWFLKSGSGLGFGNGDGAFDHLQILMEIGLVAGAGDTIDEHGVQVMAGFLDEIRVGAFGEIEELCEVAGSRTGGAGGLVGCGLVTGIASGAGFEEKLETVEGFIDEWHWGLDKCAITLGL